MGLLVLIGIACAAYWLLEQESKAAPSLPAGAGSPGGSGSGVNLSAWYQNNLDNIGQAIANWENVNAAHNNPLALSTSNGLLNFGDVGDGWGAGDSLISTTAANHPDWTLSQFINFWANGNPDNTAQNSTAYGNYVADYLGVDSSTPIGYLLGSES